jgi:hypothetical protein
MTFITGVCTCTLFSAADNVQVCSVHPADRWGNGWIEALVKSMYEGRHRG